ncbi:MAG: hypothetical protein IPJ98_16050 [Bryobacterales bacterium]|nr:hypothetical protein [Bryobacterales bacterium]
MRKQADAIQYTIRGVPPAVDRALRRKAEGRKLSLNQLIVEELALATGADVVHADFTDLVGKWTADPGFDDVIASQRKIDRKKWR